jgi:hypothetical protein
MHSLSKSWLHEAGDSTGLGDWTQAETAPADPGVARPPAGPHAAPNFNFGLTSNPASGITSHLVSATTPTFGAARHGAAGSAPEQTAAIGDLGTIISLANGSGSGASGKAAAPGSALAPTVVSSQGSGLVINLMWDSSVGSAPAGFTSDMIAAAQFLESLISTSATVNLDVGYNEVCREHAGRRRARRK